MTIPVETIVIFVAVAVVAVIVFDFTNGFHDASNMIATLVASRAMTPAQAVCLVGVFTFLGPLFGGTAVADTIGSFVDLSGLEALDAVGIVTCGIGGAIFWNVLTWRLAIPSSSSHALVLRPLHGLDAQLTSAGVIFGASLFGGPVSTTHVVSTAIMGIGASERPRAVRWAKARESASPGC